MLVLSRKTQEKILIGAEITLTVLRVQGNTVRLGIEAPRSVRVLRGELPPNTEASQGNELPASEPAALSVRELLEGEIEFELPGATLSAEELEAIAPLPRLSEAGAARCHSWLVRSSKTSSPMPTPSAARVIGPITVPSRSGALAALVSAVCAD